MSTASKLTFSISLLTFLGTVGYVHFEQNADRKRMSKRVNEEERLEWEAKNAGMSCPIPNKIGHRPENMPEK